MDQYSVLIGAVLGFLAALVPELIMMLKDHFQHHRDLQQRDQALDAAKQGYEYALASQQDVIDAQSKQIEQLVLQQQDSIDAGSRMPLLVFLRASVRPLITYSFFTLFASIKLYSLYMGLYVQQQMVVDLLPVLWDQDTESLFAAVISFWFGSRAVGSSDTPRSPKSKKRFVEDSGIVGGRNYEGQVVGE